MAARHMAQGADALERGGGKRFVRRTGRHFKPYLSDVNLTSTWEEGEDPQARVEEILREYEQAAREQEAEFQRQAAIEDVLEREAELAQRAVQGDPEFVRKIARRRAEAQQMIARQEAEQEASAHREEASEEPPAGDRPKEAVPSDVEATAVLPGRRLVDGMEVKAVLSPNEVLVAAERRERLEVSTSVGPEDSSMGMMTAKDARRRPFAFFASVGEFVSRVLHLDSR